MLSASTQLTLHLLLLLRILRASLYALTLKVSRALISVECLFSMTLLPGAFFAVFDGHGPNGHLVSGVAKERTPLHLIADKKRRALLKKDPKTALKDAFAEVDRELNDVSGIDIEYSGSTAVGA